jgi:hypothetical protein
MIRPVGDLLGLRSSQVVFLHHRLSTPDHAGSKNATLEISTHGRSTHLQLPTHLLLTEATLVPESTQTAQADASTPPPGRRDERGRRWSESGAVQARQKRWSTRHCRWGAGGAGSRWRCPSAPPVRLLINVCV